MIDQLAGLDPRIIEQRRNDPWHKGYREALARAVASGELNPTARVTRPAIGRAVTAGKRIDVTVADAQVKSNAALPGDTIFFTDGVHDFGTNQFTLKPGVRYAGNWSRMPITRDGVSMEVPVCKATLKFTRPEGTSTSWADSKCFGIIVPSSAANVSIDGLALRSNHGIVKMQGNHADLSFTHLDLQWADNGGAGYNELAFFLGNGCDGLTIDENYFHDSLKSDRNFEIWGASRFSHQYNVFYLINDVGHWMNCTSGQHSNNFGRRIHRMGAEMQQDRWPGPSQSPFAIEGNVFYDWERPYWDSMLMSVPSYTQQMLIDRNYLRGNAFNGIFGDADSSGSVRGSYMFEAPQGPGGLMTNNILGGDRMVGGIVRPGNNCKIGDGNQVYGGIAWYQNAPVGSEPGSSPDNPKGSVATVKYSSNLAEIPTPPKQPLRDPTPPPPPPPPPPTVKPVVVTGVAKSATRIDLSWLDTNDGKAMYRVYAKSRDGADQLKAVSDALDGTSFVFTGGQANWVYVFIVKSIDGATGATVDSVPKAIQCLANDPAPPPPPVATLTAAQFTGKWSDGSISVTQVPIENGAFNFTKATKV